MRFFFDRAVLRDALPTRSQAKPRSLNTSFWGCDDDECCVAQVGAHVVLVVSVALAMPSGWVGPADHSLDPDALG